MEWKLSGKECPETGYSYPVQLVDCLKLDVNPIMDSIIKRSANAEGDCFETFETSRNCRC